MARDTPNLQVAGPNTTTSDSIPARNGLLLVQSCSLYNDCLIWVMMAILFIAVKMTTSQPRLLLCDPSRQCGVDTGVSYCTMKTDDRSAARQPVMAAISALAVLSSTNMEGPFLAGR